MEGGVTCVTAVNVAVPLKFPEVAVIVVAPAVKIVAKPAALMFATAMLEELQVAVVVRFCVLPSENLAVAVNCCVLPTATEAF